MGIFNYNLIILNHTQKENAVLLALKDLLARLVLLVLRVSLDLLVLSVSLDLLALKVLLVHTKLSFPSGLMTGDLDMNSNRIYNVAQPDGDNQPATKIWSENKFLDKSSGVMAGPLNMSNNKITHLANPTADKDAVSRVYGDGRYGKKGGDTMTGNLALGGNYITGLKSRQTDYATNQPNLQQEFVDWKNAKWEDRTDNIFYKAYHSY